jgi:predicted branched-subunit amino acid permease
VHPPVSVRSIVVTTLPAAAAIAVFGTLYGAGARAVLGVPLTIASSLLVFSGALQFAMVALLGGGAATLPLLLTAAALNLRHLVLGAVLRPHVAGSGWRRSVLAFFLVDETFGFAIAAGQTAAREGRPMGPSVERTLVVSGACCYLAWQAGTLIGALGAGLAGIEPLAAAIFPVLFIGLASLAATRRSHAVRAVAAAILTAGLALALPDLRVLAPVLAGVVAALPGDKR